MATYKFKAVFTESFAEKSNKKILKEDVTSDVSEKVFLFTKKLIDKAVEDKRDVGEFICDVKEYQFEDDNFEFDFYNLLEEIFGDEDEYYNYGEIVEFSMEVED